MGDYCFNRVIVDTIKFQIGILEIPNYCFSYAIVDYLELPESIADLGLYVFSDLKCKNLKISRKIKYIPKSCFFNA